MIKALIVPTVRPDLFRAYLRSLKRTHSLDDWRLYAVAQAWSEADLAEIRNDARITGLIELKDRTHPYICRELVMRTYGHDVDIWCSTDDDMEFLPGLTNYSSPVEKVQQKGVGVVSCNWVRSEAFLAKKQTKDAYVKQPLVNMAGGMVYARKVAELLMAAPVHAYLFCDIQCGLVAYLGGLENYRYLGSLLIHRIMAPGGGLRQTFAEKKLQLPDKDLIQLEKAKSKANGRGTNGELDENNWYMPSSADLTELAHQIHKRNRAALGLM